MGVGNGVGVRVDVNEELKSLGKFKNCLVGFFFFFFLGGGGGVRENSKKKIEGGGQGSRLGGSG